MRIDFGKIIFLLLIAVFFYKTDLCYGRKKTLQITTQQQEYNVADLIWQSAFGVSKKEADKYDNWKWIENYTGYPAPAHEIKESIESFMSITSSDKITPQIFEKLFQSYEQALNKAQKVYFPMIRINLSIWQRIVDINKSKKDYLENPENKKIINLYKSNFTAYYQRAKTFEKFLRELKNWIETNGGNSDVYNLGLDGFISSVDFLKQTQMAYENLDLNNILTKKLEGLKN